MKLGTENRVKLFAALGLMVLAAAVLVYNFAGSSSTAAAPSTPAVSAGIPSQAPARPRPAARAKGHGKKVSTAPRSLDPTLRYDWLRASEDTKYEGTGRNIFQAQAEIPKPVAPAQTPDEIQKAQGPPPPPPPPPINLKFFGFASKPGEAKKVFLSEGEDVFIAAEGEVVNRHYKVLRISPTSVEIEDVLNNNRQNIPLTAG
jgi:hypothetical protein